MSVHHVVASSNVGADGVIIDPSLICHGSFQAGRIAALGGRVEAVTHRNLDFSDHRIDVCVVVEALSRGAVVIRDGDAYQVARVAPECFGHFGRVNVGARRDAWLRAISESRRARQSGQGNVAPGPHDAIPVSPVTMEGSAQ